MKRRTIYRHYPTRLDLALAAIQQMPALESTWPVDGSPRERLREAMRSASLLPVRLPQPLATAVTHAETTPQLLAASALDDAEAIEWWRSFAEAPDVIDQREET